jgi:hypothetical protein
VDHTGNAGPAADLGASGSGLPKSPISRACWCTEPLGRKRSPESRDLRLMESLIESPGRRGEFDGSAEPTSSVARSRVYGAAGRACALLTGEAASGVDIRVDWLD